MLATSQDFINGLLDHLPQKLQLIAEIAVYFALLTAMMLIPLMLWLGYAVSSTKKRQRQTA
ncbi:MAG: hypothetical protein ABJB55_02910 [Actinomycetota bacterium]